MRRQRELGSDDGGRAEHLVALQQTNIQRLLAYSSIGQVGFMLMAITAISDVTGSALLLHLSGYLITNLALFMAIVAFYNQTGNDLPFAPETMWNVGAEYGGDLPDGLSWFVRGDYLSVGDFAYEPGNLEEESYELAHFRFGLRRVASPDCPRQ